MSAILNIGKPHKIGAVANRREAAVNQIKDFIRSRRLQPGERLPTVRTLSEHFGITRDATWRALRKMQEEEWLDVLPNGRYVASRYLHTKILRSIRVRALFSGEGHIYFSGFRRLADTLTRLCHEHNLDLRIDLIPLGVKPSKKIWKDCEVVLVDSDTSGGLLEAYEDFPVPVIGLDADYSDRYLVNIVTDHHLGGRMVAEAILKHRVRAVSLVYHKGSEGKARIAARVDGFRLAWTESGRSLASLSVVPIGWSRSTFEITLNVQAFLEKQRAHGTYFVTDGRLATNFLDVLAYQGIRVPQEVSLIGYDGAQRGELTDPPMTTIQQDMDFIARLAIERIERVARGEELRTGEIERVPPILVMRDSF